MNFRKIKNNEKEKVNKIYLEASEHLKNLKINQWQNNEIPKITDMENIYVLLINDEIVATVKLMTYDNDYENNNIWKFKNYLAVHRLGISNNYRGKGISKELFKSIEEFAINNGNDSIRIDTHEDNKTMQYLLDKYKYEYRGIIYLDSVGKRFAYEKSIKA